MCAIHEVIGCCGFMAIAFGVSVVGWWLVADED